MKVLVIPEDPTNDQYILKPVVEHLFADIGRPARVEILRDPHLRGVDQSLDRQMVASIVQDNPMIDLFLLIVDRDCNRMNNEQRVSDREAEHGDRLFACLAIEEMEVWLLALHRNAIGSPWADVRTECDPKETLCGPLLDTLGRSGPGGGRKRTMRSLPGNWAGLLTVCSEIGDLKTRVTAWCANHDE